MAPTYYICAASTSNPCKLKDDEPTCAIHGLPHRKCNAEHQRPVLYTEKRCSEDHPAGPATNVVGQGDIAAMMNAMPGRSTKCEPPSFPTSLAEYKQYKVDVTRWSKLSGVAKKHQGEAILMSIPRIHDMKATLENKLGKDVIDNEDGVTMLLAEMDKLLGQDDDLEDFAKIIRFIEARRTQNQTMLDFITKFESLRSEVDTIRDLKVPDRLFAHLFLHFANPSPSEKKMAFNELQVAKTAKTPAELAAADKFYTSHFYRSLRNVQSLAQFGKAAEKTFTAQEEEHSFIASGAPEKVNVNGNGVGHHGQAIKCFNCRWKCSHGRDKCKCPCFFHLEPQCPDPAGTGAAKERERKRKKRKAKPKTDGKADQKDKKAKKEKELTATAKEASDSSSGESADVVVEAETIPASTAKAKADALAAGRAWAAGLGLNFAGAHQPGGSNTVSGLWVEEDPESPPPASAPPTSTPISSPSSAFGPTVADFMSDPAATGTVTIPELIEELVMVAGQDTTAVLRALLDTACPTSVASEEWITQFMLTLNSEQRSKIVWHPSERKYRFGGGETRRSRGVVHLPVSLHTTDGRDVPITIKFEVCAGAAFTALIGGNFLEAVGASLNLVARELTCSRIAGLTEKGKGLPIHKEQTRHYSVELRAFTANYDTSVFVVPGGSFTGYQDTAAADNSSAHSGDWTAELNEIITPKDVAGFVDIVTTSSGRDHTNSAVSLNEVRATAVFSSESEVVKGKKSLTRNEIIKLHHYYGHVSGEIIKKVILRAGRPWTDQNQKWAEELSDCDACKVNARRRPKPKVAIHKLSYFNEAISIDLKVNTVFKDLNPYILYVLCNFSRFTRALPIPNKEALTVVRALHSGWFELFGPPARLHSDLGKEFCNERMSTLCSVYQIRQTATAARNPNANGLVERQHALVDKMMVKMKDADDSITGPEALSHAVTAHNALTQVRRTGFTPNQLAFCGNPVLPSLTATGPAGLEEIRAEDEPIARNLRSLQLAREKFIECESDRTLKEALKARLYAPPDEIKEGDWIYYKQEHRRWMGPVQVTSRQGKKLWAVRNGATICVSIYDVMLFKEDAEIRMPAEQYIDFPVSSDQLDQGTAAGLNLRDDLDNQKEPPLAAPPPQPARTGHGHHEHAQSAEPVPNRPATQPQPVPDTAHPAPPRRSARSANTGPAAPLPQPEAAPAAPANHSPAATGTAEQQDTPADLSVSLPRSAPPPTAAPGTSSAGTNKEAAQAVEAVEGPPPDSLQKGWKTNQIVESTHPETGQTSTILLGKRIGKSRPKNPKYEWNAVVTSGQLAGKLVVVDERSILVKTVGQLLEKSENSVTIKNTDGKVTKLDRNVFFREVDQSQMSPSIFPAPPKRGAIGPPAALSTGEADGAGAQPSAGVGGGEPGEALTSPGTANKPRSVVTPEVSGPGLSRTAVQAGPPEPSLVDTAAGLGSARAMSKQPRASADSEVGASGTPKLTVSTKRKRVLNVDSENVMEQPSSKNSKRDSVTSDMLPSTTHPAGGSVEEGLLYNSTTNDDCFSVTLPREMWQEPASKLAMRQEIERFKQYDVVEEIDVPAGARLLSTRWVMTEKTDADGTKRRAARCCIRGDLERRVDPVITEAPTVAKPALRLLLGQAARHPDWQIAIRDVQRAFLQTETLEREVLVMPPREANVPAGRCWRLNRPVYGLDDAANGFFNKNANAMVECGAEMCKMDPATYFFFSDGSNPSSAHRELRGMIATHVDDSATAGDNLFLNEIIGPMAAKLDYGTHEPLPAKFLGLQLKRIRDGILMDQDSYVNGMENLDKRAVTQYPYGQILPGEIQAQMKSKLCQVQQVTVVSRPDLAYDVKMLNKRIGFATKKDFFAVIKLVLKLKAQTTMMKFPDMGEWCDWVIVAYSDAACKSESDGVDSCGAGVVLLVNHVTSRGFPISWRSGVLRRIATSSLTAETLAASETIKDIAYTRNILEQMLGIQAKCIPCLMFIDCLDLYKTLHSLKPVVDKRLMVDICELKQTYAARDLVQEIRHIPSNLMLADGLTKPSAKSDGLLSVLQLGIYNPPGGWTIKPDKMAFSKLWVALPDEKRNSCLAQASAHITTTQPAGAGHNSGATNPEK